MLSNRLLRCLLVLLVSVSATSVVSQAQDPILFWTPNNTVFTDSLQTLYVDVCPSSLNDTTAYHSTGKFPVELPLWDGGLASTCPGGTGTNYYVDVALKPGTNYIIVEIVTQYWTQVRDSIAVIYQLPQGSGGAPYVVAPAAGGLRLMPGEKRELSFSVTNVSQDTDDFEMKVKCTGNLTNCARVGGDTLFTSNSLAPGASQSFALNVTAGAQTGSGTVRLVATGGLLDTGTTSATVSRDPLASVRVNRMADTLVRTASSTSVAYFLVTNPDHYATRIFTATPFCDGSTTCLTSPYSYALGAARDTVIKVTFNAPASGLRKVRLTAATTDGPPAGKDSLWVKVGTPAAALSVSALEPKPRSSVARGECLSVAAGPGAGIECGDLRMSYAFPSIRTMNTTRTLRLTHLSQHATPYLSIPVRVSVTAAADSVNFQSTLKVNGAQRLRTYTWHPSCALSSGCVINVPLDGDDLNLETGDYAYTVVVERIGFPAVRDSVTGTAIVVNRKESPYGPGWWVEGLETLMKARGDTAQRLWIGGDGSARIFVHTTGGVYVPRDTVDRPEQLVRAGTGPSQTWTRKLRNGAVVVFDNALRHVRTTNRDGHHTDFSFVGSSASRLRAVQVPSPGVDTFRYSFYYDSVGTNDALRLQRVWSPWSWGASMNTYLTSNESLRISAIRESSGDSLRFTYDGETGRVAARVDRMGKWTQWEYAVAGKVARAKSAVLVGDTVATRFCSVEARTLATCAVDGTTTRAIPASLYLSVLDGPRPDSEVLDRIRFYGGRYGGVDSIVDPYGARTRVVRADSLFPALPTTIIDAAGVTSEVSYNSRGLPERTIVRDQWSSGSADTSTVEWHPTWDAVVAQQSPTGETLSAEVDPATGNQLSQRRGTGDSTRVHIAYDTLNRPKKLFTVDSTAMGPDTVVKVTYDYSGVSGNLRTVITAAGQRTQYNLNLAGALESSEETLKSAGACNSANPCVRRFLTYDNAGRVTRDSTVSPALAWSINPEASAQLTGTTESLVARVTTTYDKESRPLTVVRTTPGSEYGAATAVSTFRYDAIGRQTASSIGAAFDSTRYDKAGNPIWTRTRSGRVITQTFDALGRVTSRTTPEVRYAQSSCTWCWAGQVNSYSVRVPYFQTQVGPTAYSGDVVIPGETSVFSYDHAGRMVQADNPLVRVRRGYYPNGALKADTSQMRTYLYTDTNSGFGGGAHRTVLQYTYDRSGRRLTRADSWGGGQSYQYDALGQLAWTRDSAATSQVGRQVNFGYDRYGQMIQQAVSGTNFVDTWVYDVAGRPVSRGGNMVESMQYDVRGKRTRVDGRLQYPNGLEIVMTAAYDGFGHLVATGTTGDQVNTTDEFRPDGFGNSIRRFGNRGMALDVPETAIAYNFSSSNLTSTSGLAYPTPADSNRVGPNGGPPVQGYDELELQYDNAGNVRYQASLRHEWLFQQGSGSGWVIANKGHSYTWTFYDADDRPRFVQRHVRGTEPATPQTTYHEYWYDALGRRALVRDRSDSTSCGTPPSSETTPIGCQQAITRFTWDGNQMLREIRGLGGWHLAANALEGGTVLSPWFGSRRYTHAGGIDSPLILWVDNANPRAIVRNWRGSAAGGHLLQTNTADTHVYPAARVDVQYAPDANLSALPPTAWLGSLIDEQRDATGLLYRRNRYYDPASGRFTQPDPIGLAGGLNLYGYANGDPVNYSDPFGLYAERQNDNDCRVVKCPEPEAVISNPEVQRRAEEMYTETLKDGKERGAVLYNADDGGIRVGPTIVGTARDANGLASVPGLRNLPPEAIGSIHTHSSPRPGKNDPVGPSGNDAVHAQVNNVMAVVRDVGALYIIRTDGTAGYVIGRTP